MGHYKKKTSTGAWNATSKGGSNNNKRLQNLNRYSSTSKGGTNKVRSRITTARLRECVQGCDDPGGTGSATRLSGVASTQSPSLLEDETTNDRLIIEYNSRIYETIDVLFSPRSVVIFNVRSTVGGAA